MLFLYRNLLDTAFVATALEGGREKFVEDSFGCLVVDESARKNNAVGIIVLTDQLSDILVPNQSGSYTLVLVQGHSHAFATTTDANTWINLTALNAFCQWVGEVWVVYAFVTVCTIILYRIAFLL